MKNQKYYLFYLGGGYDEPDYEISAEDSSQYGKESSIASADNIHDLVDFANAHNVTESAKYKREARSIQIQFTYP